VPLSFPELVYVTIVLGAGAYALVRTLVLLGVTRRLRIGNVKKRRRFESLPTGSPIDAPRDVAVERGIESIERHFSVMRRLLVPLIALLALLLAAPAFLADSSATTASMIGTVVAVVVGFAVRPFLENAVAGLVISSSRLVRIGDTVRVDDWYGTIEDITATHTAVKVWDWRRYLVPNSRMLGSAFFNYSLYDTFVWAYAEFWVTPDADLDEVREIALRAPLESPYFSSREDPTFWIIGIHKDAICCWVAAWADTPSGAWALTHDMRTTLLADLRRRGIPLSVQRHRVSSEPMADAPFPRPREGAGESAGR
jgi:small-conductance mechanosensitive channel